MGPKRASCHLKLEYAIRRLGNTIGSDKRTGLSLQSEASGVEKQLYGRDATEWRD